MFNEELKSEAIGMVLLEAVDQRSDFSRLASCSGGDDGTVLVV